MADKIEKIKKIKRKIENGTFLNLNSLFKAHFKSQSKKEIKTKNKNR
jgi:hypothetical protein